MIGGELFRGNGGGGGDGNGGNEGNGGEKVKRKIADQFK